VDLSSPISSVIPSGHGPVLEVLARTDQPLTGRRVAALAEGRLSQARVSKVLRELTEAGVVSCQEQPPAKLYRLNRRHLAANAIIELATLRGRLLEDVRQLLASWSPAPAGAWMFGSASRGDGSSASDIDLLIVRPDLVSEDDPGWLAHLEHLEDEVRAWTGNAAAVVETSASELSAMAQGGERLVSEVQRDGLPLIESRWSLAALKDAKP